MRASDWFRENTTSADEVYVKLNVEGSEIDIIEDLLDSGEIRKIRSLAVTFDVRKIPSQSHREADLRQRLASEGRANIVELGMVGGATFRETIQRWLALAGAERPGVVTRFGQAWYNGRIFLLRSLRFVRRRITENAN
jgi:hypothetical protein